MQSLVAFAVSIVLSTATFAAEPAAHTVTVVVRSTTPPSSASLREMQHEAAAILAPAKLLVKVTTGGQGAVFSDQVVVLTLKGDCDMDARTEPVKQAALGWTHSSDGVVLPFADLACDNIRASVRSAIKSDDETRANLLLGRAMGRVLAHELYHIVAATFAHGHAGVAQEAFSPSDLAGQVFDLDERDAGTVADWAGGPPRGRN